MKKAVDFASGKGHQDENFPVASRLVRAELRPAILAFYRFARAADDVSDHETAAPEEKLAELDRLEAGLLGKAGGSAEGEALRAVLGERGLTDRHALDLLEAFRRDVTKLRYADWAELMDYCRYSAAPVGRFVLDLHGESSTVWPLNDALCAALQVINHLQDCGKDYRDLDRVYVPLDALAASGATVEQLGRDRASAPLLSCLHKLAQRTEMLLVDGKALGPSVRDLRLGLEVSVIQTYAEKIVKLLQVRDPLSERVHLSKLQFAGYSFTAISAGLFQRATGTTAVSRTASGA